MQIVSHHGYDFGLDTADWSNSASAEKAADKLERWLCQHDADATATLHASLKAFQDGETLEPDAVAQEALDTGSRLALEVMNEEGWLSYPGSGHNCDLVAQ